MHQLILEQHEQPQSPLRHLWLEITGRCNLECVHCYSDSGPRSPLTGAMQLADWTNVMDGASLQGCKQVQIIGGEPLVHPQFDKILDYASLLFDRTEVYTNATMLTPTRIGRIKETAASIATSVYANNAITHDAVTQRKGSFARTIANIENAVGAGIPTRASIIVTSRNSVDDIEQTKELLKSIGVNMVGVDFSREVGRGKANDNSPAPSPLAGLCGQCFSGSLCATFDGNAYPCIMSRMIALGDVREGVAKLLQRKAVVEAEFDSKMPERLADCLPRDCSPQGPQCLPVSCTPRCGPVW
jgi:MoaA/NifB/PqqE/SkfB family radical SAM enzyme